MKAKRKVYVNGGVVPKKPAAKATTKPATKTAGAAKTQVRPSLSVTAGESLGKKLQKGDVSGAARQMGEAVVGVPGELYKAFKRSLR